MNYMTSRVDWIAENLVTDEMIDHAIKKQNVHCYKKERREFLLHLWLRDQKRRRDVRRNIAIGINCGSYPTTPEMRARIVAHEIELRHEWRYADIGRRAVKA